MNTERVTKYRTRIAGTGSYLPKKLLSNHDLEKLVDTNDEWIAARTGIRNRHVAADNEVTSDLALQAAQIAIKEAGITAKDIDAIIFATCSPDQLMPNTACILQRKLGARDCMAIDISSACTGFVYGISMASDFIGCGSYKTVLVVGAEILTRLMNYKDRDTCILFGDGAGAMIVTRAEEDQNSQIYSHHLHADGNISDLFEFPMGGSAYPYTHENIDLGMNFMKMKGKEIFKNAVRTMSQCCEEALTYNKMSGSDVDWIIPHQANERIIEGVAKHFGISMDKVVNIIENMGNTSAATVPIAFDMAVKDGRIQRGQNCMLAAFGAGITSGSVLLRY